MTDLPTLRMTCSHKDADADRNGGVCPDCGAALTLLRCGECNQRYVPTNGHTCKKRGPAKGATALPSSSLTIYYQIDGDIRVPYRVHVPRNLTIEQVFALLREPIYDNTIKRVLPREERTDR